jgi:protoporphyrinogen oxidase
MNRPAIVVLGAGPAGLGAAVALARRNRFDVTVLERAEGVGGNAGSFELEGLRVDFGSHRLHPTCSPEVLTDIREMLGADLLLRPRHGRIRLRGRWIHFPLKPLDLAIGVPPSFALGVVSDMFLRRGGTDPGSTFASVLEHGLGRTICQDFYFPYAQKIWGVPAEELDAEQARRRVAAGSLSKMIGKVLRAVPGLRPPGHGRFYYPRHGFGQISEAYRSRALDLGVRVITGAAVRTIGVKNGRATHAVVEGNGGGCFQSRLILSTIPLTSLVHLLNPPAPVSGAARALHARAMVLVYLVLETSRFTEFDAHYFPDRAVRITRLSEPKNYGLAGQPNLTVLCAELPCALGDEVWRMADDDLGKLVLGDLESAALPVTCPVRRVAVRRLPHAYPIYAHDYRQHFDTLDSWVGGLDGVVTFGRQGLFAHDNTHHTLAMAYAAAGCVDDDGNFDRALWSRHRRAFESHVVED